MSFRSRACAKLCRRVWTCATKGTDARSRRRRGRENIATVYKYKPEQLLYEFLDGLVVMIRLSHSRERGSIPRRGKHSFFAFLQQPASSHLFGGFVGCFF